MLSSVFELWDYTSTWSFTKEIFTLKEYSNSTFFYCFNHKVNMLFAVFSFWVLRFTFHMILIMGHSITIFCHCCCHKVYMLCYLQFLSFEIKHFHLILHQRHIQIIISFTASVTKLSCCLLSLVSKFWDLPFIWS